MSDLNNTPVWPLLLTVFDSILEVFLLCLAGYILAGQGILDKKTQKQINRLNVSLFTPALLFSKVAFFLSPEKLRELWIVPIFFVLVTLVSMLVSFSLSRFAGLKRSQRNFAMAASMFMNSNSLPIALMQSLVVSVPSLKWGDDDNKDAMVGRALTYLVLYSTLGMIVRWSYGVQLLSQADDEVVPDVVEPQQRLIDIDDDEISTPSSLLNHASTSQSTFVDEPEDYLTSSTSHAKINSDAQDKLSPSKRRTTYYRSFPNSPSQEEVPLPPDTSPATSASASPNTITPYTSSPYGSVDALPLAPSPLPPPAIAPDTRLPQRPHRRSRSRTSYPRRVARRLSRYIAAINKFMTMPLWAALASIIVACVRPWQHALENHLLSVKGALDASGKCSIPLTLVVLGAYFYSPPVPKTEGQERRRGMWWDVKGFLGMRQPIMLGEDHRGSENGEDGIIGAARKGTQDARDGETKTVVIAVLSRMVLTPLLLMPVLIVSTIYDWHRVFEDPVFVVANVLLLSSPPALTLAQITQAASGDAFERLISRTIFWSYCVLTPPATILFVVLGLLLAKL